MKKETGNVNLQEKQSLLSLKALKSTKWSMPATLAKQILMFPVPVSRPTSAILLCDWSEKQMLYQFCGSLKTYLEVVRMGFSAFRPWWYLPLWCSSSSILSWECTEVSSGRPSARAAASKASWHSICFYKKDNRFRLQNYIWSPWLLSPAILHLFLLKNCAMITVISMSQTTGFILAAKPRKAQVLDLC